MANYAVVRTDNMAGTDVRSMLVSVKYFGADGETPTAIENGNVVRLAGPMEGEREVHVGMDVMSDTLLSEVVLIATPEVIYDERIRGLENYINEENKICRGYRFHSGDFFSVTKEALVGAAEPAVGDPVELADGTKLSVSDNGGTRVGWIHAIETAGKYTFYVIQVA